MTTSDEMIDELMRVQAQIEEHMVTVYYSISKYLPLVDEDDDMIAFFKFRPQHQNVDVYLVHPERWLLFEREMKQPGVVLKEYDHKRGADIEANKMIQEYFEKHFEEMTRKMMQDRNEWLPVRLRWLIRNS